jgi:Na+/H+-dicarboxylate symporter
MNNLGFLIPVAFFAMILGIVYMSYRKKERMALIQSGRDASILNEDGRCYSSLKWGLLLFGVGLGLFIAEFMAKYEVMSAEAAYFSMASIFGGMALIIDFFIEKYRKEREKEPEKKD